MSAPIANYLLTKDDLYLMGKGVWYRSYEKLGAHPCNKDGVEGYWFAVWAPDVKSVRVIGDFNDWDTEATYLECTPAGGVWYGFVPGATEGQLYKYLIETAHGDLLYKADPYAFYAECPPGTASRTADLSGYEWQDEKYMASRSKQDFFKRPLNIFECHLGSWKRHSDGLAGNGDPDSDDHSGSYLTYDELSVELVDYVKGMGYSHIEILPVMEHPFDGSWGYQITGYFAPTSRYGKPTQFKHFVDACHQAGIGVILDWVPGGFCRDEQGLVHFNGDKLYEKEEHPNWGTFKFDFTRNEVRNFLTSNLLYWVSEYHADGIRMDGVTSMLYLNFGIDDPSQKKFNSRGTEEDDASIDFIRTCNDTMGKYRPDVMMIAEESTAWPLVTYPTSDGGLGFHFKWDMGWMNDTLHYMQTDFPYRPGNHKLLTFSTMYQFNENFILPLSHDEVVHGKATIAQKMWGEGDLKFPQARSLYCYMMVHPGKKLNFMGSEVAQLREWDERREQDWFMRKFPKHDAFYRFCTDLNHLYLDHPALWQEDYAEHGFTWLDVASTERCTYAIERRCAAKAEGAQAPTGEKDAGALPEHASGERVVAVLNLSGATQEDYEVEVPGATRAEVLLDSDWDAYAGTTPRGAEAVALDAGTHVLTCTLPPFATVILRVE